MDAPNQAQISHWNGEAGQKWVAVQSEFDRALAPFGRAAIERAQLRAGERAMDVGCGCGDTTLELAEAVGPRGAVVGIDVSVPMLAFARERASSRQAARAHALAPIEFVQADAATYRPPFRVDCIYSRFGVMFFDDPVAAFVNLRACLVPGGRLAFACWRPHDDNPWVRIPLEVAVNTAGVAPPACALGEGTDVFADPRRVRRILVRAGFSEGDVEPFETRVILSAEGLERAVSFVSRLGPASRIIQGSDEATRQRVTAAIREALVVHTAGDMVAMDGAAWIVTAW